MAGAHDLFRWLLAQEGAEVAEGLEDLFGDEDAGEEALETFALPLPAKSTGEVRSRAVLSDSWKRDFADGDLSEFKKQFEAYEKGRTGVVAAFTRLRELHDEATSGDLRRAVWEHLVKGRLVIVDLSQGSPSVTTALSELIVTSIMDHASSRFTSNEAMVPLQVVVEEAHNLFRREGAKANSVDPWVRLSKEAAKYEIGLLYATQEVTSVDPRILSNTANWIISALSSGREVKELAGYYTFADWSDSLLRTEAKGFVRMKTESSPFIVPVQMAKFEARKD